MSETLLNWLNNEVKLSVPISDISSQFANGFLFGELLSRYKLLPTFFTELEQTIQTFIWNHKRPVIASGGAGKKEHFRDAFTLGKADAALAASVFHFGEITIPNLKHYLRAEGINVRI